MSTVPSSFGSPPSYMRCLLVVRCTFAHRQSGRIAHGGDREAAMRPSLAQSCRGRLSQRTAGTVNQMRARTLGLLRELWRETPMKFVEHVFGHEPAQVAA